MGRNPTKAANNVYYKYRKEAAKYNDRFNGREGAAEALGVSASTLADYELGITKIVPADIIIKMADVYNAPELRNYYCRNCCPLGNTLPEIEAENLDRISIETISILHKAERASQSLLDIVSDGVISEEEKPILEEVMMFLDDIDKTYHNLKTWVEKNMQ